jgi:hypothetical protein
MPKILDRLVSQLMKDGKTRAQAYAIAVSQLQKSGNLKKGSTEATEKGKKRGNMTPEERAKDRSAKRHGNNPDDNFYDSKSNSTRKK